MISNTKKVEKEVVNDGRTRRISVACHDWREVPLAYFKRNLLGGFRFQQFRGGSSGRSNHVHNLVGFPESCTWPKACFDPDDLGVDRVQTDYWEEVHCTSTTCQLLPHNASPASVVHVKSGVTSDSQKPFDEPGNRRQNNLRRHL